MPNRGKPIVRVLPGDGDGELIQRSEINCHDVLLGRGHSLNNNPGNIHFKRRVKAAKPIYLTSISADKKHVAAELVANIRSDDPPGRFLESVESTGEGDMFREVGDEKAWKTGRHPNPMMMCKETMAALREGAPEVRRELTEMENLPPVNAGMKRVQGDISGVVAEQPRRSTHLSIAQQCLRVVQNNAEEESSSTGVGDAAPCSKRVQVPWQERYDQLVEFKDNYGHTIVPQVYKIIMMYSVFTAAFSLALLFFFIFASICTSALK